MLLLFFLGLSAPVSAHAAHPLCPYDERAVARRIAPEAREEMSGLGEIFRDLSERLGPCRAVKEGRDPALRFARGEVPWRLTKNRKGKWTGISFGPAVFPEDTPAKLRADLEKADALFFAGPADGKYFGVRADEAGEAGETAHLLWLRAYRRALAEKKRKPTDTALTLAPRPGLLTLGPLLSWPAGTPLTYESLALLAFRSRDNLAADLLLESFDRSLSGEAVAPFAELASTTGDAARGWRHSPRALCEAALALRADPAFPEGKGVTPDRNRFYEFNGAFPRTLAIVHLSEEKEGGPWNCSALILAPTSANFTRARDYLDRAHLLGARLFEEGLVKRPEN